MDRLGWTECFVRTVETGSFSAVARELGTSQPNVSRYIAALEKHLGARLLHRSTRRVVLTPHGERYYAAVRPALEAMATAESGAKGPMEPRGVLRITCPPMLARFRLLPLLKPFLARHRAIELELDITDRIADLHEEGIDVALRIGELRAGEASGASSKGTSIEAQRLALATQVCVASRAYLTQRPAPRTPADLANHDCIVSSLGGGESLWPFEGAPVRVRGNVRVNHPDALRAAVLDGLGIGLAPFWLFEDALAEGAAVALLAKHRLPPLPIYALHRADRALPGRARAFVEFLASAAGRGFVRPSSAAPRSGG